MKRLFACAYVAVALAWDLAIVVVPALLAFLLLAAVACGQSHEINVSRDGRRVGSGSSVCVFKVRENGRFVFLTAAHVLREGNAATVDGHEILNVFYDGDGRDVASFEVRGGNFTPLPMLTSFPDGIQADICGFTKERSAFCFTGEIVHGASGYGLVKAKGEGTRPGDSGGPVVVQTAKGYGCAGVHYGYHLVPEGCESRFVTADDCALHLTQVYGDCPQCQQYQPRVSRQKVVERYQRPPSRQPGFITRPVTPMVGVPVGPTRIVREPVVISGPPAADCPVIVAPSQSDLKRLVAEYMAANPPPAGQAGQNGSAGKNGTDGRDAVVDYPAVIDAIMSQIPAPANGRDGEPGAKGDRGPPGEPGPRGLVGVPSEADIQNWLIGASSDPETRVMLATMLTELVAADPRVTGLIQRLEALEERSQRVLIVDGANNIVIDDETYPPGKPIVFDIRNIIGSAE